MKQIKHQNAKCTCGSGRRYKFCCKNNLYQQDNPNKSDNIVKYISWIKKEFTDYGVIDITHVLEPSNYKNYQYNNYERKNIMISERTTKNDKIFMDYGSRDGEVIVMWFGAYVCFKHSRFEEVKRHIDIMINGKGVRCARCDDKSNKFGCCSMCNKDTCLKCVREIATVDNIDFVEKGLITDCPICFNKRSIHMEHTFNKEI